MFFFFFFEMFLIFPSFSLFSISQDPILQQGWKTGAIIPELEQEIESANSLPFKEQLSSLLALESILNKQVALGTPILASRSDCLLSVCLSVCLSAESS